MNLLEMDFSEWNARKKLRYFIVGHPTIKPVPLDNMLNFKQFSSMSHDYSQEKESLFQFFRETAPFLGVVCGVVVWEAEDRSGFVEKARFGYSEEGFFYEFMARGMGNLEKLSNRKEPLVFPAGEYELFSDIAKFAFVSGIYEGKRLVGFLLVEMDRDSDYGVVVSHLLGTYLEKGLSLPQNALGGDGRDHLAIAKMVELDEGLQEKIRKLSAESLVLVTGPEGSGKKSLVKYLHKKNSHLGNFILINSIPENLGKLEKALLSWEELAAPEGVLAFDKIPHLGLGQQRIFFEWLEDTKFSGKIYFIDRNEKKMEIYAPFWAKLEKNSLNLPSLDSLEKEDLGEIVKALFSEICLQNNRESLRLSKEALNKLKYSGYPGNLEELRNLLGNAIWRSRGLEVGLDEVLGVGSENLVQMDMPTSDDLDLPKSIEALERQKILHAQKLFSGNQLRMAKALKISRGSLQYKMRNLGL